MGLTTILVHLDHTASSAARLELAVRLARRHQARLTALLVVKHKLPGAEGIVAARESFERQAAAAGIEGLWHCVDGSEPGAGMIKTILFHAHSSDLLVISQGSDESANVGVPFDFPERIVLESGRPVLVVPYVGSFATVGERVLVDWKGGRESTRAMNDAIPILKLAQRVEVFTNNRSEGSISDGERLGADLCAHLARHDVNAKANNLMAGEAPLGDLLLNRVFDEGFDLLVMGANAHGPEGRMAFGSVAHQILREMTVPVLMSH